MNQLINSNVQTMSSKDLLDLINEARISFGENPVRLNDFNNRVQKEIDDYYEVVVVKNPNNTESVVYMLNEDQCLLVSMRESKSVRKNVLEKLRSLQKRLPDFTNPVEAARAWANEVEAKQIAQKQLELAAPKVEYFDKVADRTALLNATQVGQKVNMSAVVMNRHLDELNVYNKAVKRGRVFQQWFIDKGLGELKQTETGHSQAMFTTKGEQWIVEKFISEGLI